MHRAESFEALEHFVFPSHDSRFECLATGFVAEVVAVDRAYVVRASVYV